MFSDDPLSRRSLQRFINKNHVLYSWDYVKDTIRGALIYIPRRKNIRIYSIAVLPEYQKQGISKILIQALPNKKLVLECKDYTVPFYEHLGFSVLKTKRNYYKNGEMAYFMEREKL